MSSDNNAAPAAAPAPEAATATAPAAAVVAAAAPVVEAAKPAEEKHEAAAAPAVEAQADSGGGDAQTEDVEEQPEKPAKPAKPTSVYDRLSQPKLYTGTHKLRFDPNTGKGRGKAGRDAGNEGPVATLGPKADPNYMHDQNNTKKFPEPKKFVEKKTPPPKKSPVKTLPVKVAAVAAAPASSEVAPVEAKAENTKGGSVFDRLSNPKHFGGTHKHRFDATGKGRGLAGRDRVKDIPDVSLGPKSDAYKDEPPPNPKYSATPPAKKVVTKTPSTKFSKSANSTPKPITKAPAATATAAPAPAPAPAADEPDNSSSADQKE